MKKKFFISIYLIFTLILLCSLYYQIYDAPFILDDIPDIVENPDIKNLSVLKDKLIYPYSILNNKNDPSKPITYLTFALNYHFGKLNTFGYHLVDVLLHFINSILIFFFCYQIFSYIVCKRDSFILASFVSLLFIIHPINTTTVSYVFARSGQLSGCCFFAVNFIFH